MKKVLVAEDEQAIREFVVINLKRAGYEAVSYTHLDVYKRQVAILAPARGDGTLGISRMASRFAIRML